MCTHTVLTVQRTDKYSQSHSLCFTRLTSTWTRTVPDAAHLLLQTVLQIPLRKKKRTGIIFSLLFSVFRLFSLRSRQLLSRRASHFSQILFSRFFVLAVSVVFVSLPHTIVKQLPLLSRTSPRAEFISLSSVFVRTGLCLWLQCEAAL